MAKSNGKSNLEKQLEKEQGIKEVVETPNGEVLFEEEGAEEAEVKKAETQRPSKEEKVQVVTPEMLESFRVMSKRMAELEKEIASRKAFDAPKKTEESIDVFDDYMDVPVVFFAYQYRKSLFADYRMGKMVPPPGEKNHVFFERLYRYVNNKNSRGEAEMISICQVKVQSHALCKWMREHTLFGIQFWETMTDAMSIDTTFQDKLTSASNQVSRYSEHQIIQACKMHEIPMNKNVGIMKKELINKLAKDMLTQDEQRIKIANERLFKKQNVDGRDVEIVRKAEVVDGTVSNKY